jgi:hypothetical protein
MSCLSECHSSETYDHGNSSLGRQAGCFKLGGCDDFGHNKHLPWAAGSGLSFAIYVEVKLPLSRHVGMLVTDVPPHLFQKLVELSDQNIWEMSQYDKV